MRREEAKEPKSHAPHVVKARLRAAVSNAGVLSAATTLTRASAESRKCRKDAHLKKFTAEATSGTPPQRPLSPRRKQCMQQRPLHAASWLEQRCSNSVDCSGHFGQLLLKICRSFLRVCESFVHCLLKLSKAFINSGHQLPCHRCEFHKLTALCFRDSGLHCKEIVLCG